MKDNAQKVYKKKPLFTIYKPLKSEGNGAALQFSFDIDKKSIFLEAARQKGVKLAIGHKDQFDWANKIVFKIGVADIGKLLMMMSGREDSVKCLHSQPDTGRTSVLELIMTEFNDKPTFKLSLSRTVEGSTNRVSMYLSGEEFTLLSHFVRESLTRMMGFE